MEKPTSHPLRGLLIAQFLGAFNDNAWKMIVIVLAYRELEEPLGSAALFGPDHQRIATLAMLRFSRFPQGLPEGYGRWRERWQQKNRSTSAVSGL